MMTVRSVTTAPAAETIEVFIDDKPIQVDPACTVLQVFSHIYACLTGILSVANPQIYMYTLLCYFRTMCVFGTVCDNILHKTFTIMSINLRISTYMTCYDATNLLDYLGKHDCLFCSHLGDPLILLTMSYALTRIYYIIRRH